MDRNKPKRRVLPWILGGIVLAPFAVMALLTVLFELNAVRGDRLHPPEGILTLGTTGRVMDDDPDRSSGRVPGWERRPKTASG